MQRFTSRRRATLVAVVVLGAAAVGCNADKAKPVAERDPVDGLTVMLAPVAAAATTHLEQDAAILEARLKRMGAPYRIEQVGNALRLDLALGVAFEPRFASQLASLAAPGQLLFRPALCTSGSGAAATLAVFPPFLPPAATSSTLGESTCTLASTNAASAVQSTNADDDIPTANVLLPVVAGGAPDPNGPRYLLGPAELTGTSIGSAVAQPPDLSISEPNWYVEMKFTNDGAVAFDRLAQKHYGGFLAVVVDGLVIAVPQIQQQSFGGVAVVNGARFTEAAAKTLALMLSSGPLPDRLGVSKVSPTHRVAGSGLDAFGVGAPGSEIQIRAGTDTKALATRLAAAHVGSYEVKALDTAVLVTCIGANSDYATVLRALGLDAGAAAGADLVVKAAG